MARLSPVKAFVSYVDVGGGKAVIEMSNPRSTMTLELPEDSGWVKALPLGALVTYTLEVEVSASAEVPPTGPQPGDQIRTSTGVVTIPILEPTPAGPTMNTPPDPETIRLNNPISGYQTMGLDSNLGTGETVRDLLGLPTHAHDPVATTAQAVRTESQ
jgi:hypothetical protein